MVVVELLLYVVDVEVVELLLVEEEEVPLPVNGEVWVQSWVGAVVVRGAAAGARTRGLTTATGRTNPGTSPNVIPLRTG